MPTITYNRAIKDWLESNPSLVHNYTQNAFDVLPVF